MHEKEANVKHKFQNSRSMEAPSLREHPKVDHTNTGEFCCDSCMKTYKYNGNLERRIKLVHEKEQESSCGRCNLTFKEISKFRQHINTKHNEPKTNLKEYPSSILNINEHRIDNKNSFKYLGTKLTNDQPSAGDTEIKHRKIQASVASDENKKLLKNYRINLQTRIYFLNSLVTSRLTYNCQPWPLTKAQAGMLNASYPSEHNYVKIMSTLSQNCGNPISIEKADPNLCGVGIMTFIHISNRLAVRTKTNISPHPHPTPCAMTPRIEASQRSSKLKNHEKEHHCNRATECIITKAT